MLPRHRNLLPNMTPSSSNTHGGARPGAGRKPKPPTVKSPIQMPIQEAQLYCAARLAKTLATLETLCDGTAHSVQERWVAAGTLTLGQGANQRPAYPHLPPEQLVLVSRTTNTPKPDTRAAIYLADRVLGHSPTADDAHIEEQLSTEWKGVVTKILTRFSPELAHTILHTLSEPQDPYTPVDGPLPEDQLWPETYERSPDEDQQEEQEQADPSQKDDNQTHSDAPSEPERQLRADTSPPLLLSPAPSLEEPPSAPPRLCGSSPATPPPKTPGNSTFQVPGTPDCTSQGHR